ncbi:DUF1003 domain-containing protein [Nocardia sp. NPDC088792]|uniref:DUF1003 domain-containing protein n=1 Tax=Nocardia sp. NPDC088792 TaxID=3364332 RepID=UPI003827B677
MGSWVYLGIQTLFVAAWMLLNVVGICEHWDPYPFILLNLVFSIQAAYAAPLILLGQRRSDAHNAEVATHTLDNTNRLEELLAANTELTREIHALTQQVHDLLATQAAPQGRG